jgi:hypothetical protein
MHTKREIKLVQGLITLKVGVRRPFSKVKGSKTSVTAFTNSKPLS